MRVDVGQRRREDVRVGAGVTRFDDGQIAIAHLAGELLEVRNDARVLDMVRDRRRGGRVLLAEPQQEHEPGDRPRQPPAAQAARDRAERGERDEDERAGQDDGQHATLHPEVLGHDANLVEEHQRECREHDDERRRAPE